MTNELNKPLGQGAKSARAVRNFRIVPWLLACIGGIYMLIGGWIVLVDDPMAGQPVVTALIEKAASEEKAPEQDQTPLAHDRSAQIPLNQPEHGAPLIIKIPQNQPENAGRDDSGTASRLRAEIDRDLLEETPHGALPKIASDGRQALDIYARESLFADDPRPKIAILVGGLGIGAAATRDAIDKLPADVSLGFAPYGKELVRWAQEARDDGHEIFLQVPMEPFDYPNNDPGPQTLLTSLSAASNVQRLHWVLGRMQGYVGIANYMGAKFTGNEAALKPVLADVQKRGLVFLDDGSSARSLVSRLGQSNGLMVNRAEVEIDTRPSAEAIDAALVRLEERARSNGVAIGTASALPVTLDRVIQWISTLEQRGFVLIPVSHAIKTNKPS